MDQFWEELETGEIHFRDKWQFELKSEFFTLPNSTKSEYTQEFFIFIPNSLQVNSQTYSKNEFYQAQTSLIRFKTPEITLKELVNPLNLNSPLIKLKEQLKYNREQATSLTSTEWELKLFANIFRSSLRRELYRLMLDLEKADSDRECLASKKAIQETLNDMAEVLQEFEKIKNAFLKLPGWNTLQQFFEYIEDILSISINSSATGLLKAVRSKHNIKLQDLDDEITQLLLEEKKYREERLKEPSQLDKDALHNEAILFQSGLLNKFVMDALQLKTERKAIDEKYRSLISSLAAALAMLLYLFLFAWQGSVFVINSLPFIFFTVFIYVLKDRLKEELKLLSYKQVFRWFPDYTTAIILPTGKTRIGKVHDSFGFIEENQVPNDIWKLRNEGFHTYLDMIKLPEQVIYYKKQIDIDADAHAKAGRLGALNLIFRCDIHKFMAKASDPFADYTTIDSETLDLVTTQLPKVYHINIVLKNSFLKPDHTPQAEWKKFRIIADKEGIKRIESITEHL